MKKNRLGFMALSMLSVVAFATSCGGTSSFVPPTPEDAVGDWTTVKKTYLDETDIGTNLDITDGKLDKYTEKDPLRIGLVTDSGTLNDHSFNESAWKGVNEFAMENGGGTLSEKGVQNGKVQTYYVQPTEGQYTAAGRLAAMRSVVDWGADVIVLPGYLFQGAIALALQDSFFDNVAFLALDCAETDDDGKAIEFTDRITSVIYREEQCGYLAGYAAVMDGYTRLGFVGGVAVPAVIRYGSGYVQGAAEAAKELGLKSPVSVQYYYAGAFEGTTEATTYASTWYQTGAAEVIFSCGGSVYTSVLEASKNNNYAPWIGVDVNQHADTSITPTEARDAIITSAMKNLTFATQVLLTDWVNRDGNWSDALKGNVVTVGAKSEMVKLPTPKEDGDEGCWGFEKFTIEEYNKLYEEIKNETVKVNSNQDNDSLSANNFGVDPQYCVVNYIAA